MRSDVYRWWQAVAVPAPLLKNVDWGSHEMSPAAAMTGSEAPTTPVGAETAVADPAPFVAVTATLRVLSASSVETTYEDSSASARSVQDDPSARQRRHWYV